MAFTQEQLKERQGYIGGSEAAAALGLSPFFTQLQLYQAKIGDGEPIETTIPMMVGTALEPVAIALFERETQMKVTDRQTQFVDSSVPFRRCTVDGLAPDGWIIEAKTSGDFRGWGEDEDEIPLQYIYNAAHSLACVPAAGGVYLPTLIGGRTYRTFKVQRNQELIELVKQGEVRFMDRVRKRLPPDPKTQEDLKILYPKDHGVTRTATASDARLVAELKAIKAQVKELAEKQEAAEIQVKQLIGDAATLLHPNGGPIATWKSQFREAYEVKASSFRVLRIK
jgi:putative phage-type endonuclease